LSSESCFFLFFTAGVRIVFRYCAKEKFADFLISGHWSMYYVGLKVQVHENKTKHLPVTGSAKLSGRMPELIVHQCIMKQRSWCRDRILIFCKI